METVGPMGTDQTTLVIGRGAAGSSTGRRSEGPEAPRLNGLAAPELESKIDQVEAIERLGLAGDKFAEGIFARSGVRRRSLNLDPLFLGRNLQGRTAAVERELLELAIRAVSELDADLNAVGAVVTSSLYSLGCPSLAHRVIEHYGMASETDKYHVTGVGCASAVPLLRLASQIVAAVPDRHVLVVAVESMSSILKSANGRDPRAKTIGSAIFGDGCAAALLSADSSATGPTILATTVHQVPVSLDSVVISTDEFDSHLDLSRDLPAIATAQLADLVDSFLRRGGLETGDIDHWLLHPGGRRVIEAARDALELDDSDVETSWRALAERGNVGTPSIFYVLRDALEARRPKPGDHGLAVTVGPGVTLGLMLLRF